MSARVINPAHFPPGDERIQAFARANGLDPSELLARPLIILEERLTATRVLRDEGGRILRRQDVPDEIATEPVTVPLASPPEAHGL